MRTVGYRMSGCKAYEEEVRFCKENGFNLLEIEFQKGEFLTGQLDEVCAEVVKNKGLPVVVHAVLDVTDFEVYGDDLVEWVGMLGSQDVVLCAVCENQEIDANIHMELGEQIGRLAAKLAAQGATLYIENNGSEMPLVYTAEHLSMILEKNPGVEFLLNLAHIDNDTHLGELVRVKSPKCLHISDKRFGMPHEHLPLGEGNLDYERIFKKYLHDFEGKVILEVVGTDQVLCEDKEMITVCFDAKKLHHFKILNGIEVAALGVYMSYLLYMRQFTIWDMGILAAGFVLLSWTCAYRYWRERDKGNGWIYGMTGCIWIALMVYAAWMIQG